MLHLGQSEVSIWSRDLVSTNHSSPPLVLDPDEDDARGVAAGQLLVGLIPLDHRHLLQHNIVIYLFIYLIIDKQRKSTTHVNITISSSAKFLDHYVM